MVGIHKIAYDEYFGGWRVMLLIKRRGLLKFKNDYKLIIESFVLYQTSGLYYKSFMIVICDCNDNGQYYKTTILARVSLC
jgi:hypothetical protein